MKKYIADALTLLRFISATILIVLIFADYPPEWALWVFVAGELTDAFDGIAARKWPFDPAHTPRYRQYAELYDMVTDVALGLAVLAYVTIRVSNLCGALLIGTTVVLAMTIELVVWGRPFGAPTRHSARCLWQRNQPQATTLVLLRRKFYLIIIATVIVILLYATAYDDILKISLVGAGVAIGLVVFVVKQDRLHQVKTK